MRIQIGCITNKFTGDQTKKKRYVVWDVLPDSTLLGITDTLMTFTQFWVFEAIFYVSDKSFIKALSDFVTLQERRNPQNWIYNWRKAS